MSDVPRRDVLRAAGGVALLGGLSGCIAITEGGKTGTPIGPGTASGDREIRNVSQLRFINAAPAPAELLISDDPVFRDVGFGEETDYIRLPPGRQDMVVRVADETVFEGQFAHAALAYTAVAAPTRSEASGGGSGPSATVSILTDEQSVPDGQSRVQFLHASPDAPPVDLVTANGRTLAPNVEYGQTARATLDPGSYSLRIRPADGGGGGGGALASAEASLKAGRVVDAFALGFEGGSGGGSRPPLRLNLYPAASF